MRNLFGSILAMFTGSLAACFLLNPADACCPAPRSGKAVVNADQTVIIIWDAAKKLQHFIRQASFKTEADDFGFLVPSPTEPELDESGNEAFPYLLKLTEPEVKTVPRPRNVGCGCGAPTKSKAKDAAPQVRVLQEKLVAGFKAAVLEAKSAKALAEWLKEHEYAFSPEVEAWAKPYVEQGWKITALKVAKRTDEKESKGVTASALRISFKTDNPVFPYREPDYRTAADKLEARSRLLRIYFLADARYEGELTKESPWTGTVAWAGKLTAENRKTLLEHLKLPETTGPQEWYLTEFEDPWPYKVAPSDLFFSRSATQTDVRRQPIVRYVSTTYPTDIALCMMAVAALAPSLAGRWRRWRRG